MIKYYYDSKRTNCFIFDKTQGYIIQLSHLNKTKYTMKDIIFLLKTLQVNVDELLSIKYYDEQDEGFIEFSDINPIDISLFANDVTILLRTKDNTGNYSGSNIKHIYDSVSDLKSKLEQELICSPNKIQLSQEQKNLNNITEDLLYLFSDPLIMIDKETQVNHIKSNHDKDIRLIKEAVIRSEKKIKWTYHVAGFELLLSALTNKIPIIHLSCIGKCEDGKCIMLIENKKGEMYKFDLDELSSLNEQLTHVKVLIINNCPKEFILKFSKLGVNNIVSIYSKELLHDIQLYQKADDLFISAFYYSLFNNDNSIQSAFENSINKINNQFDSFVNDRYSLFSNDKDSTSIMFFEKQNNAKDDPTIIYNKQNDLIIKQRTNGRNMELYTLVNSPHRLTLIYSDKNIGKVEFVLSYAKYLLERKVYNESNIISIVIGNRTITEKVIAKKISYSLGFDKWNNIHEFYAKIKDLKSLFIIKIIHDTIKDKDEIEKALDHLITKTIYPKVIVIMENSEMIKDLKVNKFKLTKLDLKSITMVLVDLKIKYLQSEVFLSELSEHREIIMSYIDGSPKKISQIALYYSLPQLNLDLVLQNMKEAVLHDNLYISILLHIAIVEKNDHYINNTINYLYVLFSLSFLHEGLSMKSLEIYANDITNLELANWLNQCIKYNFIIHHESNIYNEKVYSIIDSFLSTINRNLMNTYLKQWVQDTIIIIQQILVKIRNTLYQYQNFDFLEEYSSIIPFSFCVSLNQKYYNDNASIGSYDNIADIDMEIKQYTNIICFIFNTHRNILKDILIESNKTENSFYREQIEQISINLVTYYKYKDESDCSYWLNYFCDFLKEMNYTQAYQRLILLSYTINNELLSLSLYKEVFKDTPEFMLLFELYQLVQRFKCINNKNKEYIVPIYESALELYKSQILSNQYCKMLISYFLLKLCLSIPDLNSLFKKYKLDELLTDQIANDHSIAKFKIDYSIVLIEYYLLIGNHMKALNVIKIIELISIQNVNNYELDKIKVLKAKTADMRRQNDYNHIYFIHSNPLKRTNNNSLMYSSMDWYRDILSLNKYNKNICYEYILMTENNLKEIVKEYPKILVIISEDYDNEIICISNDNLESISLTKESLISIMNDNVELSQSIVILAFPNSNQLAWIFQHKVKHLITFDFNLIKIQSFQSIHQSISISEIIKSFSLCFIKKLIKGKSIQSANRKARNYIEKLSGKLIINKTETSLTQVTLSSIKLYSSNQKEKPFCDHYNDNILFKGKLYLKNDTLDLYKNLSIHSPLQGRIPELIQMINLIEDIQYKDHRFINLIGELAKGKTVFLKELCNILIINNKIKNNLVYICSVENEILSMKDSLIVFDVNYVTKNYLDRTKQLLDMNCIIIYSTKIKIPKVKMINVVYFELKTIPFDSNISMKKHNKEKISSDNSNMIIFRSKANNQ